MFKGLSFCILLFLVSGILRSQDDSLIIKEINVSGNRTTRERIIIRELTFHKGDTISISAIEDKVIRSRENLLNTSLFNYVTITKIVTPPDILDINIIVEERWYTWPAVILKYDDRNFSSWLRSKDLSRSKYGFSVEKYNCFGRKENLKITLLFGYATQFSVSYRNIALDRNRKHFIGGDIEFVRQDEIIVNTKNNEPVHFMSKFHSVFEQEKYTLNYTYRPYIYDLHNVYLNYFKYNIADTIAKLNPDYLLVNKSSLNCFTLDYVFSRDKRDSKAYPLKGSYFEVLISQTISLPLSKSSFSSTMIVPNFYKYFEIGSRLYYATAINLKLSASNTYSYFYSKSLGYIYNMNGYEYNTIEGQYYFVFKNLMKIAVLKPKVTKVPFIPLKKFNKIHYALYFNVFGDCGYVSNKYKTADNSYANRFLYSGGAGLDLVTYYDRTFRAEYSINGFGRAGFYFHLTAPINK
jgi:outer membrane protein assembly factor BamA